MNECTWTYSGDDYSSWDTTCGRMFCMTEDTPKKNDYNFCPGCGGKLIEVMPVDPPDEDSELETPEAMHARIVAETADAIAAQRQGESK